EYLSSAVESAYLSNNDKNILRVARDRDDFIRMQAAKDKKLASQAETIASQSETINSQSQEISSLTDEVSRLKKLLDDNGIEHD
ncbi:MAG: hypothetical protein K6E91_14990, partial [Butyrivibrio sp.]|nr:hypothetical protein [Butyrivibrio sp.]